MQSSEVWWERVRRAARSRGLEGDKLMADWVRDLLPVRDAQEGGFELVGPFGERRWQPTPAEHCTAEYKAAETRRLCDELGTTLGVGPKP